MTLYLTSIFQNSITKIDFKNRFQLPLSIFFILGDIESKIWGIQKKRYRGFQKWILKIDFKSQRRDSPSTIFNKKLKNL